MKLPNLPLTIPISRPSSPLLRMTVMSHQRQYDLPHQSDLGLVNQPKPGPNLDPESSHLGVDPTYLTNYMQFGTLGNLGKKSNSST